MRPRFADPLDSANNSLIAGELQLGLSPFTPNTIDRIMLSQSRKREIDLLLEEPRESHFDVSRNSRNMEASYRRSAYWLSQS